LTARLVGRCARERLAERLLPRGRPYPRSLTLNDALRTTLVGGGVYLTRGIAALSDSAQQSIVARVRTFDAFTPDNDPYGEHDFGSFDIDGTTIFWKIDLYDNDLMFVSPNPEDPSVTKRVLTILLAEEY
jgi:Protein of unknown function (DUF3768)